MGNQIKWIGYYWQMSQDNGDWIDETDGHTNFAGLTIGGDWAWNDQAMEKIVSQKLKALVYRDLRSIFLNEDWSRRDEVNEVEGFRYRDWIEKWYDHIVGLYIFDEPHGHGIAFDDQEWIVNTFEMVFPIKPLVATFNNPHKQIPENLDVISVTPDYDVMTAEQYRMHANALYSNAHDHQKFMMTLPAFSFKSLDEITPAFEDYKAKQIREYYEVAKKDQRCIALHPFIYFSFDNYTGAQNMPKVLFEIMKIWEDLDLVK